MICNGDRLQRNFKLYFYIYLIQMGLCVFHNITIMSHERHAASDDSKLIIWHQLQYTRHIERRVKTL